MSILFSHFFEKINQISPLEADFTEVLDTIALKPKMLYFYGKMPQNVLKVVQTGASRSTKSTKSADSTRPVKSPQFIPDGAISARPRTVAIVGSRHNTRYGYEVAYKLAYELAKKGVIIVSGLAFGIDSIGHQACLDAGGITVAVLGTPINQIYPREHLSLAAEIIKQGGAILSEYAPDATVFPKTSFLYRNRLISALSDIVVVVEAAERSGSLNTATHALEQGKEVFAVPGNITNPYSQGCNKLIAQGAHPYTEPRDILELLFPEDYLKRHRQQKAAHLYGDTDVETKILQAIAGGLTSGDDIMASTHLPPEVFNQAVTMLELKSRLRPLGANHWSLI